MGNRQVGKRLTGWFCWVMAVLAVSAVSPGMLAQIAAPPRAATAMPDLSGIWSGTGPNFGGRFAREDPPLQPSALEIFKRNREGLPFTETGLDHLDPLTFCYPVGATRQMLLRQFQIVQTPQEVLLLFEYASEVCRVYMDGRRHPDGWPFGWMGHSTGKYEGDTLVADTAGFNDKTWFDRAGTPHSDALQVVERFRRVNPGTLEVDFRFEDPKTFTRPWTAKRSYESRPDMELLDHVTCEDFLKLGNPR